jgi:NADH-quinone oxidoreductase subunit L
MIGIVLADNLFMMFLFWELVGFSSYTLINHFHEKQPAADAAKKAFIVNRVGDFGFLLGIIWCYHAFGTVSLTAFTDGSIAWAAQVVPTGVPLLLFCGAVGKSAQLPLHVWLPDAMEGPTPVSALIHAATMVAAGIYMLCRINVLMTPDALAVIMWVGTATALYAALCAITQRDIKKVLAYSTLSQLGYMVAAFGLGAQLKELGAPVDAPAGSGDRMILMSYVAAGVGAAMFHLTTHAFFKALMFLGSGSVIHGCHDEQDIFKMGGLKAKMPLTFITFTIGVLAIIGMPFLAGFFSKDSILYLAMENNRAVFAVLGFTVILTAFYMVRLWILVFLGRPRSDEASHAHEGGLSMTLPLVLLAVLSVIAGYTSLYGHLFDGVWNLIPHEEGLLVPVIGDALMLVGLVAAWVLYKPAAADALAVKSPALFGALSALKGSFDTAYAYYVAKVQQRFALLLNWLEQVFLSGLIIRGSAGLAGQLGILARWLHTGSLHAYVYWFLAGLALYWAFIAGVS